jgi:hypothetical protein
VEVGELVGEDRRLVLVLAREERRQELDAREVRAQAAEGAHVRHLHGVLALRVGRGAAR